MPDTMTPEERAVVEAAIVACRALVAWDDAEKAGPDYGSLTRDTHPQGEVIWQRWWDDQGRLCRHAFDAARNVLRATRDDSRMAEGEKK